MIEQNDERIDASYMIVASRIHPTNPPPSVLIARLLQIITKILYYLRHLLRLGWLYVLSNEDGLLRLVSDTSIRLGYSYVSVCVRKRMDENDYWHTCFFSCITPSSARVAMNFWPASRTPDANTVLGSLKAARRAFCSSVESWRSSKTVSSHSQAMGYARTVYPGDDAQIPPCNPMIAAFATLPVPTKLLSIYTIVHRCQKLYHAS